MLHIYDTRALEEYGYVIYPLTRMTLLSRTTFATLLLMSLGAGCTKTTQPQQVACTMEAKQCPDGSYVGRSGPNCEFAACPVVAAAKIGPAVQPLTSEHADWIARNAKDGSIPMSSTRPASWAIPGDVAAPQFHHAYEIASQANFGLIDQRNMNSPLFNDDGTLFMSTTTVSGVVFSADSGATWEHILTAPPSVNVVGMRWSDSHYIFDLADSSGAGSGEGIMASYDSTDGRTWTRESACSYFIPEKYYNLDPSAKRDSRTDPLPTIFEHTDLKTVPCPDWATQTLN